MICYHVALEIGDDVEEQEHDQFHYLQCMDCFPAKLLEAPTEQGVNSARSDCIHGVVDTSV